jgi:hypothetical protein
MNQPKTPIEMMPRIEITLQGMKGQVTHWFGQHCEEIQEHAEKVMEDLLKPENLQALLREKFTREIDHGLSEAIKSIVTKALYDRKWHGQLSSLVGSELVRTGELMAKYRESHLTKTEIHTPKGTYKVEGVVQYGEVSTSVSVSFMDGRPVPVKEWDKLGIHITKVDEAILKAATKGQTP